MKPQSSIVVFLVLLTCRAGEIRAGTFYIRSDGTALAKEEAVNCASPSTAMNLDGYDANSFSPGDTIVFCGEGGVFRSTLYVNQGGSSQAPITLLGQGAVFSGSNLVSGWESSNEYIFTAPFPVHPEQVFADGIFGDRKTSLSALTDDKDWCWESGNLYLYSVGGNPDLRYTNPGVEAGARNACIGFGNQDNLVIDGVSVQHSNLSGIFGWNPGAHVMIRNVVAEWNWHIGISVGGDQPYTTITIQDNTARYNGTGGIALLGPAQDSVIKSNLCYRNGKYQSEHDLFEEQHQWTFGIKLWEYTSFQQGNQVYFNECFENGRDHDNYQGMGVGIWLDGLPGDPGNLNVVRHNLIYDNTGNGVFLELTSNSLTLGNVLFNNATAAGGADEFTPASITVDTRTDFVARNNLIINNTSVGGRVGMKIVTYDRQDCAVEDNLVINNIFVGTSEHNLLAHFGGDNDGVNGSGNVYEYNNFGSEHEDFIKWKWTGHDTYSEWESDYGGPTYSVEGDPNLSGSSPTSLYLKADSPCIDSGLALGSISDQGILAESAWVHGVLTSSQSLYGPNPEVGAYIYFNRIRRLPDPPERKAPVDSSAGVRSAIQPSR